MNNTKKVKSEFFEWIIMIVVAIVLALIIRYFILSSTLVNGSSMEPTLKTNDRLLVNRISFMIDDLKYGDIVEFHNPNNEKEDFIKRVIAVEGDIVEIKNNIVYVNNEPLEEEYTSTENGFTTFGAESYWEIQKDEVFVLGDNRPNSNDSRAFGPIEKDSIVGIAFFRYYPFSKIGLLK